LNPPASLVPDREEHVSFPLLRELRMLALSGQV
jgi:hypothetical protein